MFVSSYNTYVQANSTNKTSPSKSQGDNKKFSFENDYSKDNDTSEIIPRSSFLAVDYIRKNGSFGAKLQLLQYNNKENLKSEQNLDEINKKYKITQFTSVNTLQNAQTSYKDNSIMFSLIPLPKPILDQTPKIDAKLPSNIQELKEKKMRIQMVNTYIENDNYYKVTA